MADEIDEGVFPLRTFLDFDLESPEPGHCTARVVIGDAHLNPNGVVHGGVVFTMADTAMGRATLDLLAEGEICASIELQLRFLRPVAVGELRVHAEVLRRGRRVVQLEARAFDVDDDLIAVATGSFAVLAPSPQT